ncbi:MAG: methyltransferase domain-containing protein [Actinomycetota bacterium]|nr:methyltransferase domain-containing protein [Actinomycetota bacterium]
MERWSDIAFPRPPAGEAADELIEVTFADGTVQRLRIQDYPRMFAVPGLYEEVVQRRLACAAPDQVADLLARAAQDGLRVLDVGAGNGVSGQALAARGLRPVVGVDLLPAAREAALRDRPDLYDLYLVADLTALAPDDADAIRALRPDALACAGAIGAGHLPTPALAAALDLLEPGALVALTVHAPADDPVLAPLEALLAERLEGLVRKPFRHRFTTTRGERHAEAVRGRLRAPR